MNKKAKRLSIGLSIFLFLCAVINFANGQIGAAVCSLGAGVFYLALSFADDEKIKSAKETNHAAASGLSGSL